MEKFIIDTNFFFNLEIKSGFGNNSKDIIQSFTAFAKKITESKKAVFYMPASIVQELFEFVDSREQYVQEYMSIIIVQSPAVNSSEIPAAIFYKLIDEIRERSYRGLRVAEDSVDQAAKEMVGREEMSKIEYQKKIGKVVSKLRERYRTATRVKFLDSVADLDIIMLAKELEGTIVSSDEGVLIWGRIFGVREVPAHTILTRFKNILK